MRMAKLKIVPQDDYKILKKYLDAEGIILVSADILEEMEPKVQEKIRKKEGREITYNFGGRPDICVDFLP